MVAKSTEMYFIKQTGLNIRRIREAQGISQAQLKKKAGLSIRAISKAERGESGIKLSTAVRIADALNVALDELVLRPPVPLVVPEQLEAETAEAQTA